MVDGRAYFHNGIDIACESGSEVRAATSGRVSGRDSQVLGANQNVFIIYLTLGVVVASPYHSGNLHVLTVTVVVVTYIHLAQCLMSLPCREIGIESRHMVSQCLEGILNVCISLMLCR